MSIASEQKVKGLEAKVIQLEKMVMALKEQLDALSAFATSQIPARSNRKPKLEVI